jgi:hypothetical protein
MHKCLKCGKTFERISEEMLRGCPECGGNLFLYLRGEAADLADRIKIEEEGVELELPEVEAEEMTAKRLESVRILSPGVYELNFDALLERKEIIMAIKEEGSYAVHLPSLFDKKRRGKHF